MDKNTQENVLITGGSGFVGKNLVEYLQASKKSDYHLFFPFHKELELLDTEAVRKYVEHNNIQLIVHCANCGGSRKTNYDEDKNDVIYQNEKMFFNLVNTLNGSRRMIFLGSGAEYDRCFYNPKMKEEYFDQHIPQDEYGFSKYVCSKYIELDGRIINLRLFGVFGKYEDYTFRFVSNAIVKSLLHLPITIKQNVYFDYLYVNDLVKIIEYFLLNNQVNHCVYNVTPGKAIDLLTIANIINAIADNKTKIIVDTPGLNTEYSADISRLLAQIPEVEFTAFDQAITELYAWYKKNLDALDKQAIVRDEYLKYCKISTVK